MGDRWVGQVLGGRYQIEELLGQGGMSAVYKARDPNLQRTVAIKLIHAHLSNHEEFVRRFETEATAIARLRHPNIVQVYDFNHDDDIYYMVLEYVAGETLQSRLKRLNQAGRRLPLRDSLHTIIEVCKAADYAHQRGMIHRDIKPANVMLDVNGGVILMDFGIAHILGGSQHTATGAVLGTALYMSPEQIQGLHPDARSDIYSIGVMLFETLVGRPPFEADSAMTLMMMHLNDPVPDITQLNADIPDQVREIVNKALEKDRTKRFQTAAEMAAALEMALGNLRETPAVTASAVIPQPTAKPPVPTETIVEPATPAGGSATFVEPIAAKPAPESVQATVTREKPVDQPQPAKLSSQPASQPLPVALPSTSSPKKFLIGGLIAALLLVLAGGGFLLFKLVLPMLGASTQVAAIVTPTTDQVQVVAQVPTLPVATATLEIIPTSTLAPAPTQTATNEPTATATEAAPLVIGGADQIAFMLGREIWIANIDGSGSIQITKDGTMKNDLRWLPDGQGLSYISGKCIYTVDLTGAIVLITCFNNATYLDSFDVSPDGTQVAISLDRQLYLVPFDLKALAEADTHSKLAATAACEEFAPYQRNFITSTQWSKDGKTLLVVTLGVLSNGQRGDVVQVFAVDKCTATPDIQIQFPEPHFTFDEYTKSPTLTGLTWDSASLFVMNGILRNGEFGNLQVFNWENYKAALSVNPIDGACCYSDPQFSPDGKYLLFAYQAISGDAAGQTQIYYIQYGTIGSGATYSALPLPGFTDPKEDPQVVLRPSQ